MACRERGNVILCALFYLGGVNCVRLRNIWAFSACPVSKIFAMAPQTRSSVVAYKGVKHVNREVTKLERWARDRFHL